jgi:hypothetical protein
MVKSRWTIGESDLAEAVNESVELAGLSGTNISCEAGSAEV